MKTYFFATTEQACAETQSTQRVKSGDLLIIASERVVGIADARPFAVSLLSGKFDLLPRSITAIPGIPTVNIEDARAVTRRLGFDRPANDPPLRNSVWEKGEVLEMSPVKLSADETVGLGWGA